MNSIDLAFQLIKQFEGFSPKMYKDPTGIPTIGYGSTNFSFAGEITQQQAEDLARQRLHALTGQIEQLVHVDLNDNQMGALLDFCYNVGLGNFERSTMLVDLNNGAFGAVADQFNVWTFARGVHLPGLVKRRQAERALFLAPIPQ